MAASAKRLKQKKTLYPYFYLVPSCGNPVFDCHSWLMTFLLFFYQLFAAPSSRLGMDCLDNMQRYL